MAAHEGAVSGRTVLFALLFAVMVLSVVMCAYLLGRIIGGSNMSAFTAISSLLVKTGVIPKETVESLGPGGKLVEKNASRPTKPQRTKGRQSATAAALACPTEDPVTEADSDDTSTLDPIYAYDRAAGRSNPQAQGTDAGDLAASGPLMVPTAAGFVSVRSPGAIDAASASGTALVAGAAPGAPVAAGTQTASSTAAPAGAAAPAAAPAPIPHLSVPAPAGAAQLPPPIIYSVELGFFLSDQAAADFAGELQKRGIAVNLVSDTDAAGRIWTYVRSGHFTDSVQALSYAAELSQNDNLSGQIVTETAVASK